MGSDSSPTRVRRPDGAGAVNAAVPDEPGPGLQRGLRRRGSDRASISPATDLDWGQPVSTTQPVSSLGRAGDRGLVDELQLRADSRRRPAATPVRFTQAPPGARGHRQCSGAIRDTRTPMALRSSGVRVWSRLGG